MTDKTSIVNLALQSFGSRTTVTAAELVANSTNEAIQANLTYNNTRDGLLRMAPWDCAMKTANLVYITSMPGTPENSSTATALWQPGQPSPPWAYEYQYPVDCLRACQVIPATQTGFTGIPITTAITGYSPSTWLGMPVKFKVAIDTFICVINTTITNPGSGYVAGDFIFGVQSAATEVPSGAPVKFVVNTVDGAGAVLTYSLMSQVVDAVPPLGGSYFSRLFATNTTQGSTSGIGTGFTYNPATQSNCDQRVILTNQEYATLLYVRQVTDPNVWDPLFQDAMQNALGADLCMALSGDKSLANACINRANKSILQAREVDGNEGLTINDVTPDWIRVRGIEFDNQYLGPYSGFDWGGTLSPFA